ncbi:hypothetical protein EJB05_04648, partial [Eragrostis curvula]
MKTEVNRTTPFQGKESVEKESFNLVHVLRSLSIISGTGVGKMASPSFPKKSSANEAAAGKGGSRWRSDESSEDEDEKRTYLESGASLGDLMIKMMNQGNTTAF